MPTLQRPLPSFWRTDKGLTALLIFLVLLLFVAPPFIEIGVLGPLVLDIFFALILISGVSALSRHRAAKVVAVVFVAFAVTARVATFFTTWIWVVRASQWVGLASMFLLAILTLAQVFRAGPITPHRILGAVAAYLLVGISYAEAYALVAERFAQAFNFAANPDHAPLALVYFSFTTLTTVGYGDITPLAPVARSLAMSEALVGQLFPAILIARLVSMEINERAARPNERGGEDSRK